MLLEDRTAVIYGGGGTIGGAVAREFARQGATVFLAGRTRAPLERLAGEIADAGGRAECAQVDALDEESVNTHAQSVAKQAGGIDITLNAVGRIHDQGTPLAGLSLEDFQQPITEYTRTNFLTAKAAARHMAERRRGVILTLSTPGSRLSGPGFLGYGVTCAAIEAFSRILAGELGGHNIRVVCLRPDMIPEALATSYTGELFRRVASQSDTTAEALLEARAQSATLLGRLPTLDEVAAYAAFVASDRAGAMTGAIANLSCGSLMD
ncbi:SDR family oxidoreductase [Brevibacterium daeguense]|uniref:SDR family oxidoreductase n=1 Tax=Brevibacterium daeguense TaxID=909936 RepID=A0ABP8EH95_9MICO|nr:SDR family oxidoreductase [Brevibacterium daeguense]